MRVTAISDTHGRLPKINSCDLLLIGGDISPLYFQRDIQSMDNWMRHEFKEWINGLHCVKVILIPGNHDFYLKDVNFNERQDEFECIFDGKLQYLSHEEYIFTYNNESVRIFGTPYCHKYGYWPFMKDDYVLTKKFKDIPENLDILLTHDPAFELGDSDMILDATYPEHAGNKPLMERLEELNETNSLPRYLLSGHIHSGDHELCTWSTMDYANISYVNERYEPFYKPLEFEI